MISTLQLKSPAAYDPNIPSVSRTTSLLIALMPEDYDRQNVAVAETLSHPSTVQFRECIRVLMFFLSNKIPLGTHDPAAFATQSTTGVNGHIMEMLLMAGLLSENALKTLSLQKHPTAQTIVERIFEISLTCCNLRVIRILLQCGMRPNKPIFVPVVDSPVEKEEPELQLILPLEFAAQVQSLNNSIHMTRLLLSFRADPNGYKRQTPASIAVRTGNHQLLDILLANGARVSKPDLVHAVMAQDVKSLCLLFDTGLDVNMVFDTPIHPKITPLGYFSWIGNKIMAQLMISRGANPNFELITEFEGEIFRTTPLGLASGHGHLAIMEILTAFSRKVNFDASKTGYIPHIVPAVANGHMGAVQFLLSSGADIKVADEFKLKADTRKMTLLERCQVQNGMDLYHMLIDTGAKLDPAAVENFLSLQMMWHWKRGNSNEISKVYKLAVDQGLNFNESKCVNSESFFQSTIRNGNCDIPRLLRLAGAPVSGRQTPSNLHVPTVMLLDHLGILSNVLHTNGQMILINATLEGVDNLVNILVQRVPVNQPIPIAQRSEQWRTALPPVFPHCKSPLEAALYRKNLNLAQTLIQRGAPISESELNVVVWQASIARDISLVELFIGFFEKRFPAPTAMTIAIRENQDDFVRLLMRNGFSPSGSPAWPKFNVFSIEPEPPTDWWNEPQVGSRTSILEVLAELGNQPLLKEILAGTPWSNDEKGCALAACLRSSKNHLISDLLSSGASINNDAMTAAIELHDVALVRTFIAAGAILNPVIGHGDGTCDLTPLQQAVKSNEIPTIELLIQAGADINAPTTAVSGITALQLAVQNGNMEVVKLLLDSGADGATALQVAAKNGFIGIVSQLLDRGVDINAVGSDGTTALITAAEHGRLDMVQLLIHKGNIIRSPHRGQILRAISKAVENGHWALVVFMEGIIGHHTPRAEMAGCASFT